MAGRVREATPRDLDSVGELWSAITEHHAGIDAFFTQRSGLEAEREVRELIRRLHRERDAAIFVVDAPDASPANEASILGICIVRIDRAPPILEETERGEITDLFVRSEARRRGVASELADSALSWLRAAGVDRVEIQVAVGNAEGQAFWRALGFGDLMDVLQKRL
ncbi:MAG: GNAT family N-acetyltransferase [Myxococcota bacterium]|nr:GNAT family N-acetyltransferase [Myxococcota bacterium]